MSYNEIIGYDVNNCNKVGKIHIYFCFVDFFVSLGRKQWLPLANWGMSRKLLAERCILLLTSFKLNKCFRLDKQPVKMTAAT